MLLHESLEIEDCNALLYLPCEMVGSSLESLVLENLSSLHNAPGIIDCMSKLARQTRLRFYGIHQLLGVYYDGRKNLQIDVSMMGLMGFVVDILRNFPSIEELELR